MASFNTLIRPDTLTLSLITGSNRKNRNMEGKTQYEYTNIDRTRDKEPNLYHGYIQSYNMRYAGRHDAQYRLIAIFGGGGMKIYGILEKI